MSTMKKAKRARLERRGWRIGSTKELLGLTDDEAAYIELKLALSRDLRKRRLKHRLTQIQAARLLRSSQSRIAKMEAGDPSVSIDLLVRSLLALGATKQTLTNAIKAADSHHAV
jgi:hypothetical protein